MPETQQGGCHSCTTCSCSQPEADAPVAAQPLTEADLAAEAQQREQERATQEAAEAQLQDEQANAEPAAPAAEAIPGVTGEDAEPFEIKDDKGNVVRTIPARYIKIRVPKTVPDSVCHGAWGAGMHTVQSCNHGMVVIFFPTMAQGENGQPTQALGHMDVFVQSPDDANRILKLGQTVNLVNMKMAQAAQNPINAITAAKEGTIAKDNATRELVAQQEGNTGGGIVLADAHTPLPKPTDGKPVMRLAT